MGFTSTGPSLSHATRGAVRYLLSRRHPQLFSLSALQKSFDNRRIAANKSNRTAGYDTISKQVLLDKLAVLNGFSKVSKIHCPVSLAEGVIAVQNTRILDEFTIYSRPSIVENDSSTESKNNSLLVQEHFESRVYLPPFREDDFTMYRTLENRLDTYLNNKKESWMECVKTNPIFITYQKLMVGMMPQTLKGDSQSALELPDAEQLRDSFHTDPNSTDSENEIDVVVLYQAKIVVLEKVLPSYLLLALPPILLKKPRLPYKLKHNTASTIIYVSLVTFGAVPLAYRSIKYALDYPAMVELLLASFFGTLAYSIWYSRYGARVRQQLSIERALGSRIIARDNAALAFLVEGAVKNVSQFILQERSDHVPLTLEVLNEMGFDPASIAREIKDKH